ncbi:MAG: enoyl-CoA hydratase-related protein [Dehalococcoidia bacterium]
MIDVKKENDVLIFSIRESSSKIPFCFELEKTCNDFIDDLTKVLVITSDVEDFVSYCHINNQNDCIGLINTLLSVKIPVIAAIELEAKSCGLELISACDIRICRMDSKFSLQQIYDEIPFRGATQILPRLIGKGRALDLILTSREIDSIEAENIGLISYIDENSAIDKAMSIAESISENSAPIATKFVKEAIVNGINMPLKQGILFESDLNIILHSTKDRSEGINSFIEKRVPKFKGE